jgi:serine/threonine-protein kinase RsbW
MADPKWIWTKEVCIPNESEAGKRVLDEVVHQLEANSWNQRDIFGVHLSVEEALVNAMKHGNGFDASKKVRFCCHLAQDRVRIQITDEGSGFNPADVPDCTDPENLEAPSGRGLMLMRSFMSNIQYNDVGNSLTMEKCRSDN